MIFIGHSENTLDNKNRLIIPTIFRDVIKDNDTLSFSKTKDKTYFKIHTLETLKEEINEKKELLKLFIATNNIDMYNKINEEINTLYISVMAKMNIDNEHRVVIPRKIVDEYDVQKELFLVGNGSHIKVYTNEEDYNNFIK